jgi:ribonucleotide monophosphatase NagD (HAD superfamily)
VAGKPHHPTAQAIAERVGAGELRAMVGDRPSTDGALADQLGIPFALVLSGVTREGDEAAAVGPRPARTATDLRTLVADSLQEG